MLVTKSKRTAFCLVLLLATACGDGAGAAAPAPNAGGSPERSSATASSATNTAGAASTNMPETGTVSEAGGAQQAPATPSAGSSGAAEGGVPSSGGPGALGELSGGGGASADAAGAPVAVGGSRSDLLDAASTGGVSNGDCVKADVSGALVPAELPLTLEAELSSSAASDYSDILVAPLSTRDSVAVTLGLGAQVFRISADGVSQTETGFCGEVLSLVADDRDEARIFARTARALSDFEHDYFFSLWTSAQPAWQPSKITTGTVRIISEFGGTSSGYSGVAGVLAASGEPRALATPRGSTSVGQGALLLDLAPSGEWRVTDHIGRYPSNPHEAYMVVDSLGRTRIVYAGPEPFHSRFALSEWTDGEELAEFRTAVSFVDLAIAAGPSGMLGVARHTAAGIAVTASNGQSVSDDVLIPDTVLYDRELLRCFDGLTECQPVVCQTEGVVPDTLALAATSDGGFWLAYRVRHVRQEHPGEGTNTRTCFFQFQEFITSEVVLVRVSPGDAGAASQRWVSPSSAGRTGSGLDLAARGDRLYLGTGDAELAHVYAFDWKEL